MSGLNKRKKVEVYWNLHKKIWSVRHKGRVVGHMKTVDLYNVEWVVQPAGRRRVLQEGRKNVHAFARGYIGDHSLGKDVLKDMFPVTYNPYKVKTFVRADTYEPVFNSQYAMLQSRDGRPYVEGN